MYASFEEEMFNRAAKQLDRKIEELGGKRIAPLGLGDDMDSKHYRAGFDKWVEDLLPKLLSEVEQLSDDRTISSFGEITTEEKMDIHLPKYMRNMIDV